MNGVDRGIREGGGREGKMGSGEERRERVALSELRIIITVVVGEETPRGCAGIHDDGPGGEKDERSVRFQGDGKGCIYPPPIHIGTRRH